MAKSSLVIVGFIEHPMSLTQMKRQFDRATITVKNGFRVTSNVS
jgi:hypothetical protein